MVLIILILLEHLFIYSYFISVIDPKLYYLVLMYIIKSYFCSALASVPPAVYTSAHEVQSRLTTFTRCINPKGSTCLIVLLNFQDKTLLLYLPVSMSCGSEGNFTHLSERHEEVLLYII